MGVIRRYALRKRCEVGRVDRPPSHLHNLLCESEGYHENNELPERGSEKWEISYEGHLVASWYQRGILDAVAEHSHEQVETVKRKWRKYPWRGIYCVITDRDEESSKRQNATLLNCEPHTRLLVE